LAKLFRPAACAATCGFLPKVRYKRLLLPAPLPAAGKNSLFSAFNAILPQNDVCFYFCPVFFSNKPLISLAAAGRARKAMLRPQISLLKALLPARARPAQTPLPACFAIHPAYRTRQV